MSELFHENVCNPVCASYEFDMFLVADLGFPGGGAANY